MLDCPRLPIELLEIVIEAARHDLPTLRGLSLVSQFFLVPCQRYIFRKIVLNPPSRIEENIPGTKMCSNLLDILRHNYVLCRYVQEIHFIQEYFSRLERSWLLDNVAEDILSVLSYSPIRSLSIVFPLAVYTPQRQWSNLSSGFRQSLYQTLHNPHFRHLTLSHIEFIPNHLPTHFPNITHLTLTTVTFSSKSGHWVTAQRNQNQTSSRLHHLELGYSPNARSGTQTTNPFSNIDTSQISSLVLSLPDTPRPTFQVTPLLQLRRLKVLHIHFTYSPRWSFLHTDGYKLDFTALTSLEELTFSGKPSERHDKRNLIFWDPEVKWCLSTYSSTRLKHLKIILKLGAINVETFLDDLQDTLTQLSCGLASAYEKSQEMLKDIEIRFETEDRMVLALRERATSLLSWKGCEGVLKVEFPHGFVPCLPYELC